MIPSTTTPRMPMGAAAQLPLTAADLAPSITAPPPPMAQPPPQAAGLMAGPGGTPLGGGLPDPGAPAEAPYDIEMQPDGSAIWKSKTTPSVVIGVVPAPKLPPSLQPPK